MTIPRRDQSCAIALSLAGLLAGVSPLAAEAQTAGPPAQQTLPGLDDFSLLVRRVSLKHVAILASCI